MNDNDIRYGVEADQLYTPSEVAAMMRVNPKTVTRWARSGQLPSMRTLGGHRRFLGAHVLAAMAKANG
jgi:excisionase family DNA binding protein